MPPYTRGFASDLDALEHFEEHCQLLGAETVEEYVTMADKFLGAPLAELPGVEECQRPTQEWVRYNSGSLEFGVVSQDRMIIRTYYISEAKRRGGRSFREYCYDQCHGRWAGE